MELLQNYSSPSLVAPRGAGLDFSLSTEEARSGVRLEALVRHSTSYGRVMLALHRVVSGHAGFEAPDHSAYQEWVQGEYLKRLEPVLAQRAGRLPLLQGELAQAREQLAVYDARLRELNQELATASGGRFNVYWEAKRRYWAYLYTHHKELWWILDPVVSVHPDAVLFEVFSRDESSYGCVRVPMGNLDVLGQTRYGTTNVDYSPALADEMARVRDYRAAFSGRWQ